MKNKYVSSAIYLIIAILLLFLSFENIFPESIIRQGEMMALGLFMVIIGFFDLFWKIIPAKQPIIPNYVGIIVGLAILIYGLYSESIPVMAPGMYYFLIHLYGLLKKKFPDQTFFGE